MTLLLNSMRQKDEDSEAAQYIHTSTDNKEQQVQAPQSSLEIDQEFSVSNILPDNIIDHVRKESNMNIKKLNETIESMTTDLGESLLATDIWTVADGFSIAGYNPQPKAAALFNQLTSYLNDTLQGSGFPGLGKYYMLDLLDNKLVIVLPMGEYRWGILVDNSKIQLGLLLNIIIPRIIDAFEEALTD
jgi:hypothetical protein